MSRFTIKPTAGRSEFTTTPSFNPNPPTVEDVLEAFDETFAGSPIAKLAAVSPIEPPDTNHGHEAAAGGGWQTGTLLAQIDYWKDRCMAAEQALDAAVKSLEQELESLKGNW